MSKEERQQEHQAHLEKKLEEKYLRLMKENEVEGARAVEDGAVLVKERKVIKARRRTLSCQYEEEGCTEKSLVGMVDT